MDVHITDQHRELFCSTRHHLGIYRCVAVSARYQLPPSTCAANQEASLTAALTSVVKDQPLLRVGILKQDTGKATFSHTARINLRNHLEWRSSNAQTTDEYEAELATTQGWVHDQLWPDIEVRPPWRMIAQSPSEGLFTETHVDVLFAFHHALTDGTGGKEFHQHLIAALRAQGTTAITNDSPLELSFPDAPELPEPQEQVIAFKNTSPFLARTAWDMLGPSFLKPRKPRPWTAKPICLSNPYKTRVHPIYLESAILQSLVKASRDHSTTLTGLLHALILISLSRRLPPSEASSFASSTPISLRPWISPKANPAFKTKLRALVTAHRSHHPSSLVSALRAPSATDDLIWQTSYRVKQELNHRMAKIPVNDIAGLMPLVPDFFDFWTSKEGKPRDTTWEVSNVGALRQGDGTGWKITRAMFTNGAMVAGSSIGFNVASVEGSGLTVSVTWQEGDVPEELVEGVRADVSAFAERWHQAGKFLE